MYTKHAVKGYEVFDFALHVESFIVVTCCVDVFVDPGCHYV